MERISFAERVKLIRKYKNLNKLELSRIIGVSSGYISEIEQGKKNPGLTFLISLQRELGISIDWFLTGIGSPFIEQKYDSRDPVITKIVEVLEKLSERNKNQVLDHVEERKLLADLLEERKHNSADC